MSSSGLKYPLNWQTDCLFMVNTCDCKGGSLSSALSALSTFQLFAEPLQAQALRNLHHYEYFDASGPNH